MKIKMLPNWCKKLGFVLFISFFAISGYQDFMHGFTGTIKSTKYNYFENIFSISVLHLFEIISLLGMLIYMFSKEKIEDDYINKLRLESFQLTSFVGLGITIISYTISEEIELTLDYFIILFLWIYLATFALKKRIY
ncbi:MULTISPECIES: hypothetical protein [unclassified Polaribacter]|uniref:hypothetical protein n=1 Tax=unclassified Polaribacter TaxID=196858 RepID=UPI0011BD8DF9|nr:MULTISPECIES: hypothetical protein [unclassified Polaribacter]TXD50167.1 hypothetical protein ES043_16985 [Polaribacter sp. IC063]TXD56233.1 hypothetical protein ES044_17145 [Polaribacter sp. IC066]